MNKNKIKEEIQDLIQKIEFHNYQYYVLSKPEISDLEYDQLFERLKELEKIYPELKDPNSPTSRVGSDIDNQFPEVRHSIPVLSLDKAYSTEEILSWIKKTSEKAGTSTGFTLEPKIDGFSVVLYYQEGRLIHAVSRGNGEVGNDITENVKTIQSIPLNLKEKTDFAVRGEIFIEKKEFELYNQKMGNIYANPRNFAAGSIRRIKSSEVAAIPLKIFCYDGFSSHLEIKSNLEMIHFMKENQLPITPELAFFSNHQKSDEIKTYLFDDLSGYLTSIQKKRSGLAYEIDGLVLKVNDFTVREELGYTSHHPRWALAFKFESPQNISKVLKIDVQVGRTGKITPLAYIEPVKISGTTVSKATLHNQEYIDELELGIGDTVMVSKRGEIIPAIEKVVEKSGSHTFIIPPKCPECKTELIQKGAHRFCPNSLCPARIRERAAYFVQTLEIENIGKETVKFLLENHFMNDLTDLFHLDYSRLLTMEGFGAKKIELMKTGLEKSREKSFETVLAALGLEEVGPKVIEILIQNGLDSIDKIIEKASLQNPEAFLDFHGIGEATALSLIRHFNDLKNLKLIEELKKAGFHLQAVQKEKKTGGVLEHTVWAVTGSFEHFKPREKALETIQENGGSAAESITKKTTHLLAGGNAGNKIEKAKKMGIQIVNEKEFLEMLMKNTKFQDSLF